MQLFISHASEDKDEFVEPLAHALRDAGFDVWYDRFVLNVGDSLRRKINEGLVSSDYGVVVLSPHFFAKEWPKRELDGLTALESVNGKSILPIWKDVTKTDVLQYSPIRADKVAVMASDGIATVVDRISQSVGFAQHTKEVSNAASVADRFLELDQRVTSRKKADAFISTPQGLASISGSKDRVFSEVKNQLLSIGEKTETLRFAAPVDQPNELEIRSAMRVNLNLRFVDPNIHGMQAASIVVTIFRPGGAPRDFAMAGGAARNPVTLLEERAHPDFDSKLAVVWKEDPTAGSGLPESAFITKILTLYQKEIEEASPGGEKKPSPDVFFL